MAPPLSSRAIFVGPSPAVLKSIRTEMKSRKWSSQDLRMRSVTAALAAEPSAVHGLNEGIFYAAQALPSRVAALSPSLAVRGRPTSGHLKCLVLLVEFSDNKGKRPASDFRDMLFSQGSYPTGSMHDFYNENSCSQLNLQGDIVGWIQLPQSYSYYVNGQSGTGPYPQNAQKMVEDALSIAKSQINFKDFDQDGDGYLDGLFVVHAGGGAEADPNLTTRKDKIWSHQWNITQPIVSNGVTAYAYCTEPEDGNVGVFCHEFGHMLGLPDLYDTTYRSSGVGVWCVMGGGSWNNGGQTPAHFCAWSKARLGWLKPTVVKNAGPLSLAAIEDCKKGKVYRSWTGGKAGTEYFLLENRQQTGFDAYLPAGGLLIWHIDDSQHNNDHPGSYWVGLVQADGKNDLEFGRNQGDEGDPYPGESKNKRFDASSNPNSDDILGNPTGVAVTLIALKSGIVTCNAKV
jgi:immune inhibitor A